MSAYLLQHANGDAKLWIMQMAIDNCLSVNEVADLLGLTTGRIRQLLIAKELKGKKLSPQAWVIDRHEVERFARRTGRELHAIAG